MFNSPSGWYKTCLRCDVLLRNTFNINVENVKRVGAIVADSSSSTPINYGTAHSSTSSTTDARSKRPSSKETKKTEDTKIETKIKKTRKPSLKSTKTSTDSNQNIRSYFTSAAQKTAEQIAETELENIPIEEFFDSNDGFNDFILPKEAEANVAQNNTNITLTRANTRQETILDDDLAAVFNDGEDDVFADFQWDSERQNSVTRTERRASSTVLDESFSLLIRDENDCNDDDYIWGSAAKNAKLLQKQPPTKKAKTDTTLNTNNIQTDNSYSWGSNSQTDKESSAEVKCTGCHQVAKELSVKKDGPNKGRLFYVCSKNNPCKFFKWADEINAQTEEPSTSTSSSSWGSSLKVPDQASGSWNSRNEDLPEERVQINCNCNKPANSLTVRKDGPNKGRGFYACSNRDKSCGFFQWADQNENQGNSHSSWGSCTASTSTRKTTSGNQNSFSRNGPPKARKCGLCRQEGHSRQKCPRKAEFEF